MIAVRLPTLRMIATLPLAAVLASCTAVYDAPYRDVGGDAELAHRLAGTVAGPPVNCLPRTRSTDSEVIDRDTILYRDGRTLYVQNTNGACYPDGNGAGYTLVYRKYGSSDLCQGDVAQVIDSAGGSYAGNCVLGEFTPYRPAGMTR